MSLISCKNCNKNISSKAKVCNYCEFNFKRNLPKNRVIEIDKINRELRLQKYKYFFIMSFGFFMIWLTLKTDVYVFVMLSVFLTLYGFLNLIGVKLKIWWNN